MTKLNDFNSELIKINQKIVSGVHYKQVLDYIFDSLQPYFPCERISIALLSEDILTAHWLRTNLPVSYMNVGFSASIKGSSLKHVIESNEPRIIEDLKKYAEDHPQSRTTKLAIMEGIMSSLTCPLISRGKAVGVIFFSSSKPHTYKQEHIEMFKALTNSLALVVEQGRLQKFYEDNQNKNKMFTMITHDLKSPIGVMSGFLDLLHEEDWYSNLDTKEKEIFSILRRNCDAMLELVNDLSESDRLRSNQLNLVSSNLADFFRDIAQNAEITTLNKKIHLEVNIAKEVNGMARFDPLRLRQAIENLISNAVKFSKEDTTIRFNVKLHENLLNVSVKDQGPGIPENEISKLFKEHGKTSIQPTAGEQSTGWGLFIVKKIAEQHGGTVNVTTKLGSGSTFEFSIPIK
jgi:signal transduction histidine kinase